MICVINSAKSLKVRDNSKKSLKDLSVPVFQAEALQIGCEAIKVPDDKKNETLWAKHVNSNAIQSKSAKWLADFALSKGPVQAAVDMYAGPLCNGLKLKEKSALRSQTNPENAQQHMRIISALYGLLRPYDGVRPYRLETNAQLSLDGEIQSLRTFWKARLAEQLSQEALALSSASSEESSQEGGLDLKKETPQPVVALACSQEYANLVDPKILEKNGVRLLRLKFKTRATVKGKQARGMFCRFVLDHKVRSVDGLKAFTGHPDLGNWRFCEAESSDSEFVFEMVDPGKRPAASDSNPPKKKQKKKA